MIQNYLKIT